MDVVYRITEISKGAMISRKDNLLNRPWQQRRYENHRRKVQSALPAIDTKPPQSRHHVTLKLKKRQKETERCEEIEKNNFLLLKKMSYIMRTSRVDNCWVTPQPNFLNKISMFKVNPPEMLDIYEISEPKELTGPSNRKMKCVACTPQEPAEIKIPEERVPWEAEKKLVSRKRSQSVPVRKPETLVKPQAPNSASQIKPKPTNGDRKPEKVTKTVDSDVKQPQSIFLKRGCLKLAVNFPSDSFVKFQRGNQERIIMHGTCHCKNRSRLGLVR